MNAVLAIVAAVILGTIFFGGSWYAIPVVFVVIFAYLTTEEPD
jgi:hypothetical protein